MSYTAILDRLIVGAAVDDLLRELRNNPQRKIISKVTSKCKKFICVVCEFETKFSSALKTHMTKLHSKAQHNPCQKCELTFDTKVDLELYVIKRHQKCNKRSKETIVCESCESSFESEERLMSTSTLNI